MLLLPELTWCRWPGWSPRCLNIRSILVRIISIFVSYMCREKWPDTRSVKVRLQSQPTDRPLSFTGPFDCFKQTYMKEGLRGLYRVWVSPYPVSFLS